MAAPLASCSGPEVTAVVGPTGVLVGATMPPGEVLTMTPVVAPSGVTTGATMGVARDTVLVPEVREYDWLPMTAVVDEGQ
jgi:hypothetical protein